MSRDDPEGLFITLFPWEAGPEAFMGPQLVAFPFSKEAISSWDVGLDRPQAVAQWVLNLPHPGKTYCRLVRMLQLLALFWTQLFTRRGLGV